MIYGQVSFVRLINPTSAYHRVVEFVPLWVKSVTVPTIHKTGLTIDTESGWQCNFL